MTSSFFFFLMVTFIEKERTVQEISIDSKKQKSRKTQERQNLKSNKLRPCIREGQLFPMIHCLL